MHLPAQTTGRGRTASGALAATLLAGALAALLACVIPGAAQAARSATVTAATSTARARTCAGANLRPSAANARALDAATLCLINQLRSSGGVRPLRANTELARVAAGKVTGMVRCDYFADDGPAGQTPMSLVAGTRYAARAAQLAVGQNIAWGSGGDATPAHIVAQWMASAPHREVMLSGEFRDAGVGVVPAVPGLLHVRGSGASYAIELGARR